jgi:hypothetical protein
VLVFGVAPNQPSIGFAISPLLYERKVRYREDADQVAAATAPPKRDAK